MADYRDIELMVIELAAYIDGRIESLVGASFDAQKAINEILREELLRFEIEDGRYKKGQDLRKRLNIIEYRIEEILGGNKYAGSIKDFLTDFREIQNRTSELHKVASDVTLPKSELNPARVIIQERATEALTKGVAAEYVEPVKRLIADQVLQSRTISETVKLVEKWNLGDLSSGRETQGVRTPNLQRYATQIGRDTAYSVQRTTNDIFRDKFGMKKFIYAGNLVKDSRPLCRHLVGLDREIELSEMPPLIKAYPEGLYPGTDETNFMTYCGGYACRHIAMAVI